MDGVPYHIDTNSFTSVFTPTRGSVGMIVKSITSYETYKAPTSYTWEITPTKKYPEKTIIIIEVPPVVTVLTTSVPTCTYLIKGTT